MKKKKQKQKATTAVAVADDLDSKIHCHGEFFNHLIELIPARFYLSNDDESKPWYQGLSKAAKASLKQQSKQNLKLARRNRFDPENNAASTVELQQQKITKLPDENIPNVDDAGEIGSAKAVDVDENKEKSVTYEELRLRLRRKIESLKGNRGEGSRTDDKRARSNGVKRKRSDEDGGGEKEVEVDEDGDEEVIEYGKVRLGDEDKNARKGKKRKLPKAKELERAKRVQESKRENPSVAERESWKAAASRAMGVKVHDDARLIKESMRRDKKRREKNTEKWKDRVQTQEKMKQERQQKRKENIVGRINDKKMRKIAKREKKLMRPGFEGRKEGYITQE